MHIISTFFNYFEYIFWFILVFTIIVFIHEFGHYIVARINNVDVERFSIGFGPVLFSKTDKNNTKWQIGAIPLGGYVKFCGDMYSEKKNQINATNKNLFVNKKSLQKASIVFAGPAANFLLSFLLFIFIFLYFGRNETPNILGSIDKNSPAELINLQVNDRVIAINDTKINSFEDIYSFIDNENLGLNFFLFKIKRNEEILEYRLMPEIKSIETFIGSKKNINYLGINPLIEPIVGKVLAKSPASFAGLKKNDRILNINNMEIKGARQIINIVKASEEQALKFLILRNNKEILTEITPKYIEGSDSPKIGILFKKNREKLKLFAAIKESINNIFIISVKTLIAFWEILFGKRDHCEVGGPILIAKVSTDIANTDYVSFIALIALISINLGLINLFPLPLLDGGHLLTYLSEFVIGKNINYNLFRKIQILGVIIIVSFMTFSILNDIFCRVLN